ncbi:MAG: cytochrome c biogenesis protein ResB, partial [Kiritimatiellae bacterium]|nr:cytochrome c biogenesis protein ResB [Kiritimatiellia bacterium]
MKYIFSMKMAVMMLFLFAVVIGASTFIENDYGTQTANALVYKAMWFEVFLAYFIAILIFNIIKYKSYKGKIPVFLFHFSFIVIAIGALVTRYVGYEGIMAIREGAVKYEMISNVKNLQVQVSHKDKNTTLSKELYFSTLGKNNLHETLSVNKKKVDIELVKYLPTVHEKVYPSKEGKKYLEFKISTGNRGEIYYLAKGEKKDFGNFYVGYEVEKSEDKPLFLIREKNSTSYTFNFPFAVKTLNMNDKKSGELNAGEHLFKNRMLYQFGSNALVFKDVHESAVHKIDSHDIKTQAGKPEYMQWKVSVGKESKLITTKVYKGQIGNIHQIDLDGVHIDMRVGAKRIDLPFGIKLLDFQLERYPGSKTPASFASEVVLIDKEQGIEKPYRIYMNH